MLITVLDVIHVHVSFYTITGDHVLLPVPSTSSRHMQSSSNPQVLASTTLRKETRPPLRLLLTLLRKYGRQSCLTFRIAQEGNKGISN